MSIAIPWREYLKSNPSASQHEKLLLHAENYIGVLAGNYNMRSPLPKLLISPDDSFNAQATDGNEIWLAYGLFEKSAFFADLAVGKFEDEHREDVARIKAKFIIFWVIAHEFFHITRSHFAVLSEFGASARRALEFDADVMAIAGLYRWFGRLGKKGLEPKALILDSVFWPVRVHAGSSIAADFYDDSHYPSWHLRLYKCFEKLIQLDNEPIDWDTASNVFNAEFSHLMKILKELDGAYCSYYREESSFMHFMHSGKCVEDARLLGGEWDLIQPIVEKHQRLLDHRRHKV